MAISIRKGRPPLENSHNAERCGSQPLGVQSRDSSGFEFQHLRSLQIGDEIELRRLERDIAGLHPAQNLVDQVFTDYAVKNLMK